MHQVQIRIGKGFHISEVLTMSSSTVFYFVVRHGLLSPIFLFRLVKMVIISVCFQAAEKLRNLPEVHYKTITKDEEKSETPSS